MAEPDTTGSMVSPPARQPSHVSWRAIRASTRGPGLASSRGIPSRDGWEITRIGAQSGL